MLKNTDTISGREIRFHSNSVLITSGWPYRIDAM